MENKEELPGSYIPQHLPDYEYIKASFNNNQAFMKKIFKIFIESSPDMIRDLQEALAREDYDKIQAVAHKLKSSIQSFRIDSLQDVIKTIESHAKKRENIEDLPKLVEVVSQVLWVSIHDVSVQLQRMDQP